MVQNFPEQQPLQPENQLWLWDRYVWRTDELGGFTNALTGPVAECTLIVSRQDGDFAELIPSFTLFAAGDKTFSEYPDRVELALWGQPVLLNTANPEPQSFNIEFTGTLTDEALMRDPDNPARFDYKRNDRGDYELPARAVISISAVLIGEIQINTDERPVLVVYSESGFKIDAAHYGTINLSDWVIELRLDQRYYSQQPQAAMFAAAQAVDPEVGRTPRILRYQCVFFTDGQSTSGEADAPRQLAAAEDIWDGACITFQENADPVIIHNATLLTCANFGVITGAYTPPTGVIPIFFVHNSLAIDGGGITKPPGSALARVVISDMTTDQGLFGVLSTNSNLLAHEMGHVFGGVHPGEEVQGKLWQPQGTPNVLEATGAAHVPNSTANPLSNCGSAHNVVMDFNGAGPNTSCQLRAHA